MTTAAMRPARVFLVLFVAAAIVGGHLYDIASQREHWPFSNYPMYAKLIRKNQTSLYRLYGLMTDGTKTWEMPIVADNLVMYVPPVNELRMKNILDYAWSRNDGGKLTRRVLRDYMAMYEERRILGRHATPEQGPRMLEAICKRLTWKLDPHGATVGPAKEERLAAVSAFPPIEITPATIPSTQSLDNSEGDKENGGMEP